GFLTKDDIIIAPNQAIYDPEYWVMAVLCSRLHNVWSRTVNGRVRTDIRYSSVLCYNTFPIPPLTDQQKESFETHVVNVNIEREKHSEKTLSQLYSPSKMPPGLLQAHQDLDVAVERAYRSKPFNSDEERLEFLLSLYEGMIQAAKGKAHAKV
ncbi:MAG: SAM-dependent methyltransferase, partial [Cyanobacteria bacterium PR.3.49]|nr:SAM-dependent methyltransferase [Cyanobacteria bacterium PR.3.49]